MIKPNSKSKSRKKAEKAKPYVRRTLKDKRVHNHLADAAGAVHKAYGRASRRGGAKALEDKKLYDDVRAAVNSLSAALGIVSRPVPQEPKRTKRKAFTILVLAGAAGLVAKKVVASRRADATRDYSSARPAEPVEPARSPQAA